MFITKLNLTGRASVKILVSLDMELDGHILKAVRWEAVTVQSHARLDSKFPQTQRFHFRDVETRSRSERQSRETWQNRKSPNCENEAVCWFSTTFYWNRSDCSCRSVLTTINRPGYESNSPSAITMQSFTHTDGGQSFIGHACARQNMRTHKTCLWFAAAASNHGPIKGIFAVGSCFKRLNPLSQRGACAGHCRHPGDTL